MSVGVATSADIAGLVSAHREAFPEFFLTMLGERFLHRFYSAVVRDPGALCFVARSGGHVVGFVSGPLKPAGFFRKLLLREGIGFCVDAIPALLRRPGFVVKRLWGAMSYRGEPPTVHEHAALVSSIAVSPAASGRGLGRELLNAFCVAAAARGASYVYLLTDRDYNSDTNQFYLKSGFALESQVARAGGRAMNRYVRDVRRSDKQ